ncbi:phytoene/squalene synthase family protein [Deinococcus sp. DB0503]|uniref:phytoene/squalene synthase family protein n=1 Tax=Deinococcus sp. DB0503 TaxID=2479203 RepID=UPI0018DF95DB|nr:phytoene/squalene synthase family protein [Deinococcus sp. DB0503]MBI0446249.1 phytoene/squalene synthase family protein [Deinococcus sp. DB0503]
MPYPAFPSPTDSRPPAAVARHCWEVTRQHSRTFSLGSRFFPAGQREAVWAVYAACRAGDDSVDECHGDEAKQALAAWWARVQAAFAGRPGPHPIDTALAWAVSHWPIPLAAFEELHEGLRMDLEGYHYRDLDDLTLYCRRVAGVVGFMIAPICGYDGGERTLARALRLGQAMQLTNILRDVGEDLERGRVYLPETLLREYGVTRAVLEAGTVTPGYRALMRHLSALARAWYAEGRAGIPCLRGRARIGVQAAARAYEGILDDLARGDFDNFRRRAHVSGPRKLLMLPQAWWEVRGAPP